MMKPSIRSSISRVLSASKEKKIHVPSLSHSLWSFNNALRMPTVLRDRLVRGERGDGGQKAGDGDDSGGGEGEEKKERIGDYEWRETESVE